MPLLEGVTKDGLLLCGTLLLVWFANALAGELSGPVVSVVDGDTIDVLHNNRTVIADMDILIS